MKRLILASAVSAAVASFAPVATAETVEASGDASVVVAQAAQQRAPEARAQRPASAQRAFVAPSERVEARLAYARTALEITDSQQSQWESFANVLRKHARAMDQRFQERRAQREAARGAQLPDLRSVSAIERLERQQQRMAQRSTRLSEVIAAAKPLYAALSPEQKQIADGMLSRQGRGGHRHHHHRGMHRAPSA